MNKASLKPYLTITILSEDEKEELNILGLLDSGADAILVPIQVAEYLNIPAREKGVAGKVFGIGNQPEKTYTMDDIKMKVVGEQNTKSLSVHFMEKQPIALLGRSFFEQYKSVIFNEDKKEVELVLK